MNMDMARLRLARNMRGQTTVEYLLILATAVAMFMIFVAMFHTRLVGAIFTIIGAVVGTAG